MAGSVVLFGWLFSIRVLTGILIPGQMVSPNAAIVFLLLGTALILRTTPVKGQPRSDWIVRACAGAAGAISLAATVEYFTGINIGIDDLTFRNRFLSARVLHPSRMGVLSAAECLLVGLALFLLDTRIRRRIWPAQLSAALAALMGILAVEGHLFEVSQLYRLGSVPTATPAAVVVVSLGLGTLLARPNRGWMMTLISVRLGGRLARKLLPVVILMPILVAWLRAQGEKVHWYETGFGIALFTTANILILAAVVWWSARWLNAIDLARARVASRKRGFMQALRESEQRFRLLAESGPQLVWTCGADGACDYLNQKWMDYTGIPEQDQLGYRWLDQLHPEDREPTITAWQDAVEKAIPFETEFRIRGIEGQYRWFIARATALRDDSGRILKWLGANTDITERREREADQEFLLGLGAELQRTADAQAIARISTHAVGEYFRVARCGWMTTNQELGAFTIEYEYLQSGRGPLVGTYPLGIWGDAEFLKPLAAGETLAVNDTAADPRTQPRHSAYAPRGTAAMIIVPLIRDGRWVGSLGLAEAAPRRWSEREILLARAAAERIWPAFEAAKAWAEERKAHQALAASEQRFRRLVEADVVGLAIGDEAHLLEANNHLLKILGYTREEFAERPLSWREITPPEYEDVSAAAYRQLASTGACPAFEKQYFRKDGSRVPVLIGSVALDRPSSSQSLSFIVDLTDRKRLEEQFRQAQKLETVGLLAGGVAHDFNNLLTVISGYAEMLLNDIPSAGPVRPALEQISGAADRAAALTRQLLAFSRRQPSELKVIAINEVVKNLESMLGRLIGAHIDKTLRLAVDAGSIRADPGQIEQVILNLAVNARDAMPHGGKLLIETGRVSVDDAFAQSHFSLKPGRYASLTVSDTGAGMTPEIQARIFEPFFTTKAEGKGTGLGLATVYGIVNQSGGSISVHSEPGRGATFRLLFPAVEQAGEASAPDRTEAIAAGTGTILLAEDNESVRSYVRQVLEGYGYTVLETSNGEQALKRAREYGGQIDLLLTDLIMPGLGGIDLIARMADIRPQLPVLSMSGYADNQMSGIRNLGIQYIQKPFTPAQLVARIQALLNAR